MPQPLADSPSDEELACRARGGCAESFEELVRRYQTPVLHFLRHRGAGADAEDLLQETFFRAYKNLALYRESWRLAAWLFTIARRVSINHHRRPRIACNDEAMESIAGRAAEPVEVLAEEESRQSLWNMAARILSEQELTAVWLFYVEDMPVRQIAAVLDRSWVAVKMMLFRARKRLFPLVARLESEDRAGCLSMSTERRPIPCPSGVEVRHV
jgi:RNA polymerase sigma-70 factor, ECF subfamily